MVHLTCTCRPHLHRCDQLTITLSSAHRLPTCTRQRRRIGPGLRQAGADGFARGGRCAPSQSPPLAVQEGPVLRWLFVSGGGGR
ncbi:unnamed protein product [Merluccius merluccius]